MPVTLRQIAQVAHVSVSTASRALNNHAQVSVSTRRAVLQAARQLDYPMARLRSAPVDRRRVLLVSRHPDWKTQQDVGILAVDRRLVFGVQSVLEPEGISVRVQSIAMDRAQLDLYVSDPEVAGLVLLGGMVDVELVHSLCAAGTPFVVAGARVRASDINCVTADYLQGAQEAARHLISAGRRRIGLVNGPASTTSSDEKLAGFRLALCTHGLSYDARSVVVSEEFASEPGHRQTVRLLQQVPDLDGVIYAGDPMAIGGLRAIKETGRRVPDDVAVIGYYDSELARFTDPPLTSVCVDMNRIGQIAARRLAMMLDAIDNQAWCVTVPASLTVHESA
jgi:DNA-binding LacI/PurR family transcriptional regulator